MPAPAVQGVPAVRVHDQDLAHDQDSDHHVPADSVARGLADPAEAHLPREKHRVRSVLPRAEAEGDGRSTRRPKKVQ
jgi:hypothetical protein